MAESCRSAASTTTHGWQFLSGVHRLSQLLVEKDLSEIRSEGTFRNLLRQSSRFFGIVCYRTLAGASRY
jgi:hypothetical protein